ncbi:MAG: ADP-ribosylglycohydrolase family protein [Planctomycetes bacterium]|nr:ADP-ribosylglycohydrolase family protein [Planctomycetota bacterium]
MIMSIDALRTLILDTLDAMETQGHDVAAARAEAAALPPSYDALTALAARIGDLPMRDDWPCVEPVAWQDVLAEMDPARATAPIATLSDDEAAARVREGFLVSVCGCELGKPLEINATLEFLREKLSAVGEWPIADYVTERAMAACGRAHPSAAVTTRENLAYVVPDDDINYTLLGMLNLEQHGRNFTLRQLADLWLHQLSPGWTWGPERVVLLRMTAASMGWDSDDPASWAAWLNPRDEWCGAMIRADAYGFACVGDPASAAELAFRDASLTHRRTGVYGTMFAAAAIAAAACTDDPLEVFEIASQYVPQRSRFCRVVRTALDIVSGSTGFMEAYEKIHGLYGQYGHCRIFQESATLINTLRFAADSGDGICRQVMQGNDTDSYGCTAGSILGVFFGPGRLEPRWLAPFRDALRTSLAAFWETSLAATADRIARLPGRIARQA